MDPTQVVNLALVILNAGLNLLAHIRSQGGLTDDQILAQAQATTGENSSLIQKYLASLPPAS
jgi:hypothetical protein